MVENGVIEQVTGSFIPDNTDLSEWRTYQNWLIGLDADGEDLGTGPNEPIAMPPDDSGDYELIDDTWVLNDLIRSQRELDARQTERIKLLQAATIDQFDMIIALFTVGRDKGLWAATDFSAELRAKVVEWMQLIEDYKNDTAI